jgi:hypothetical protein
VQFFSRNVKTMPDINGYTSSASSKASRFFAVGTAHMDKGTGHLGIFTQSGNMVSNSVYRGFGVTGGYEYPISTGKASGEQTDAVLEFDTKSLYLDTYRTVNLGLRFSFANAGQITLAVADIKGTNAVVLTGGYNF